MTGIVLMLVLAVTVEGIVQYIKSIIEMVTKKDYKTAVTQLSALVISVALCLMAGADVYGTRRHLCRRLGRDGADGCVCLPRGELCRRYHQAATGS